MGGGICNLFAYETKTACRWRQVTVLMIESLSHSTDLFKMAYSFMTKASDWIIYIYSTDLFKNADYFSIVTPNCVLLRVDKDTEVKYAVKYFFEIFLLQSRPKTDNIDIIVSKI